jgi:hypothetical protein
MPNTNAGFAFFWSNHPIYGTQFAPTLSPAQGAYQDLIPEDLRDLNEAALDRALLQRGVQFVLDDPGRYALLSLSRIPVYFLFWPTADSSTLSDLARVFSFGLFLPLMIYGLAAAVRQLRPARPSAGGISDAHSRQRAYVALMLLFISGYTLIHLASWANVRYRLPVDAFLILFAAYGIEDLYERWRSARRSNAVSATGQ